MRPKYAGTRLQSQIIGVGGDPGGIPWTPLPTGGKSLYGLGRIFGKHLINGKYSQRKEPGMALASDISPPKLAEAVAEKGGEIVHPEPLKDRSSVVKLLEDNPGEFNRLYEAGQIPTDALKVTDTEGEAR